MPINPTIYVGEGIVTELVTEILSNTGFKRTNDRKVATLTIERSDNIQANGVVYLSFTQVYALVAPFPTIMDGISSEDIRDFWRGQNTQTFDNLNILMSKETLDIFSNKWGQSQAKTIRILSEGDTLAGWLDMNTWALIPFDELTPRWKVISIDGVSPLDPNEALNDYPLAVSYEVSGNIDMKTMWEVFAKEPKIPRSNRETTKMTRLVMTGVTALVRATAFKMDLKGITYPAQDIGDWLQEADITHISNEVAFIHGCPKSEPASISLRFCSDPKFIGLLVDVGADVIELTGNHLNDWKTDAIGFTLDMYRDLGWQYFGGGRNLEDSRKPAKFEHNSNRIAFIGCNTPGPDFDWATEIHGGSAACGDYTWMIHSITNLRNEGYKVVATVQFNENYSKFAGDAQQSAFRPLADAGAVIVQGSQAHTPKEMEFRGETFIHYGLGNLFFDQMNYIENGKRIDATRYEFIDRYIFYKNRLISIELLTAMLEDFSKPRPMTIEERQKLLQDIFSISHW